MADLLVCFIFYSLFALLQNETKNKNQKTGNNADLELAEKKDETLPQRFYRLQTEVSELLQTINNDKSQAQVRT